MVSITENLQKIKVSHGPDALSEAATVELDSFSGGYQPGDTIQFDVAGEQREFVVEGISKELGTDGWSQSLSLLSPMQLEGRKSPKKKQIFFTLSQTQYDDFRKDYAGSEAQIEYHPWILIGDEFGERGWNSNQIIETLGQMAGTVVHSSLPAYWVKQFTVEPGTPILSAIKTLVSPMEPFIYSVAGHIFITEGGAAEYALDTENVLELSGVRMVREEVIRKEKPSQIRLRGNVGRFRPERFKGPITSEPYQWVLDRIGDRYILNYAYGIEREYFLTQADSTGTPYSISTPGKRVYATPKAITIWGPNSYGLTYDIDTSIVNGYSEEEVSIVKGKDIFNNASFTLSETRSTYKYRHTLSGLNRVLFSREKAAFIYENTHWSFSAPREYGNVIGRRFYAIPGRITSLDQMVFFPQYGQVVFGLFENMEETRTYYWYTREGELAAQGTTTEAVVYTDDGVTYKELKSMAKDDISPWGILERKITSEESISYTQISKDSYGMRRVVTSLGPDGRYDTDVATQIVQAGAVQGSPVQLRKMQTYAERGAASRGSASDTTAVMDTPSRELSINTPSWESLESILPFLEKRYGKDEVLRTYQVMGELNVHVGLQIDMESMSNLDGSEQIPIPALDPDFKPVVVGYEIQKDVTSGKAVTTLVVRGRLQ